MKLMNIGFGNLVSAGAARGRGESGFRAHQAA